jgi:uncharacterized protein
MTKPAVPITVAIAGASGLIGTALSARLAADGDAALRLVRRATGTPGELAWSVATGVAEPAALERCDAVVCLAGANLADGRWTTARKAELRDSRIASVRALLGSLRKVARRPRVFVSASAIGYYGSRGDEVLTEQAPAGSGFLATLCQDWEAAAREAEDLGMRQVNLRFGVVLARQGGMLDRLLPVFRAGLGGPIGAGRQYISWITLNDAIAIVLRTVRDGSFTGPVNVVSPNPVTNAEFTAALAGELHRPAFMRVPAFAARLAFGELADETLLASTRAAPDALQQHGFQFQHPELAAALHALLSA